MFVILLASHPVGIGKITVYVTICHKTIINIIKITINGYLSNKVVE